MTGPSSPVGSKQYRVTKAIHWHFTSEKTDEEIADQLGVSRSTVREYLEEPPADEVRRQLNQQEFKTRLVAFEELKRQLQVAGERSRTAEAPVKIYENENGEVEVTDVESDDGSVEKIPVVQDIELLPDEEARYYGRSEARKILEMMIDLVGAAEPDEIEHSGGIDVDPGTAYVEALKRAQKNSDE